MKIHKKSQEIGRNTILGVIVLLFVLVAMAYLIWQFGNPIKYYIDKIFP